MTRSFANRRFFTSMVMLLIKSFFFTMFFSLEQKADILYA